MLFRCVGSIIIIFYNRSSAGKALFTGSQSIKYTWDRSNVLHHGIISFRLILISIL